MLVVTTPAGRIGRHVLAPRGAVGERARAVAPAPICRTLDEHGQSDARTGARPRIFRAWSLATFKPAWD